MVNGKSCTKYKEGNALNLSQEMQTKKVYMSWIVKSQWGY